MPIFIDTDRRVTRLWATVGVRLTKLEANYARPPHVKPVKGPGQWKPMEAHQLGTAHYLIAVDEFAEVELDGLANLTRDELRPSAIAKRRKRRS